MSDSDSPGHGSNRLVTIQDRELIRFIDHIKRLFTEQASMMQPTIDRMAENFELMSAVWTPSLKAAVDTMTVNMSNFHAVIESINRNRSIPQGIIDMFGQHEAYLKGCLSEMAAFSAMGQQQLLRISEGVAASSYFLETMYQSRQELFVLAESSTVAGRLFSLQSSHSGLVAQTMNALRTELDITRRSSLLSSIDLSRKQLLSAGATLKPYLPTLDIRGAVPGSANLNAPYIQQRELLDTIAGREQTISPAAQLSEDVSSALIQFVRCDEIIDSGGGQKIIKPTTKFTIALAELPFMIAEDEMSFGTFIDHLYILYYEGAGSHNLRFLTENGGILRRDDCGFIWRLKHMRNHWFRHDVEHGTASEVVKKKRDLAQDLSHYGFNRKPLNTDEFRCLQIAVVKDMCEFIVLFKSAVEDS